MSAACGTYAGAQRHYRSGEDICDECRIARNEYQRKHRKTNPNDRERNKARARALWRLAAMHHDDFERLYVDEYRKAAS